jgi:hypothetical protein
MSDARIAEMNRILARPPALGLSVEPTLGMYVVAKLAHRHGLAVELIRGVPGLSARITIGRDHLEVDEQPGPRPFDAAHTERLAVERARVEPEVEFSDPETREYVEHGREVGVSDRTEQVVDLTEPRWAEPGLDEPVRGLPVRTPGLSFSNDDEEDRAVSAGEGASQIRAALSEYDRGRKSAADSADADEARMWDDSDREASD